MRLKFPNTPPFKPDKERFIKSQEFRLESSELKSLSHLGRKGVWGKGGGRSQHLVQQIDPFAKKNATGLNPNFPNTSNTLKTPEDPETLRTLKGEKASEGN